MRFSTACALLMTVACATLLDGCVATDETFRLYTGAEPVDQVWDLWSHDSLLSVGLSDEAMTDKTSLRIAYPDVEPVGYHDWTLENRTGLVDVVPGETWTASAWVKIENTERIGIEIIALSAGTPMEHWTSGLAAAFGTADWRLLEATGEVPPGSDQIRVRLSGAGKTTALVDDVSLRRGTAVQAAARKPEVEGWAFEKERVEERLGRGLVALPRSDGTVYLSWRLLVDDSDDTAFNVYREGTGGMVKLNDAPITRTTDFVDSTSDRRIDNVYVVRQLEGGTEGASSVGAMVKADPEVKPYLSIPLDSDETTFHKVAIGDLNGDGRYDFVIKTPNSTIDPYHTSRYWRPSEATYKLEAYLADGTFLWRRDLGWNIESGAWYSPYIVYDFDGDGLAEVAVKTGPEDVDLREPKSGALYGPGRVMRGPEYVSILNGMTGEETVRADWPSREGVGTYSHVSRNLMAVAYLDGKTPCIILERGTYTVQKLVALQYFAGRLGELWSWDSTQEPGGLYYGQGDHYMHAVDVDDDGRDEIVIGAAVIDDNGVGLWSSGLGHSDNVWVGDIDPSRPGLEIYLGIEGSREKGSLRNGISLRDAKTGEILWGLDRPTYHVHSSGLVSDIDLSFPGMEAYSGEKDHPDRWLHSAQGELIADRETFNAGLHPKAVYWDASTDRELLLRERIWSYPDETLAEYVEGHQVAWLDLHGDWREEIITAMPGELRIYSTPIAARDRRVTLVQDALYRSGVAHFSMGYHQQPLTSYFLGEAASTAMR